MCRVIDTGCCLYVVSMTLVVLAGVSCRWQCLLMVCRVVDSGCCWCVVWLTLVVADVSCR